MDCPTGFYSNSGDATCAPCVIDANCPLVAGATTMKCENKTCIATQCYSQYYLHNNKCYPLNGNFITFDYQTQSQCISTTNLCINNYINWTDQFCFLGGSGAFNFDYGVNVSDNSSSEPKTQIYTNDFFIYTKNNTEIANIFKGNAETAFLTHFLNDNECKSRTDYGNNIYISPSSNNCSGSVYSLCVKTIDSSSHVNYYAILFYLNPTAYYYGFMLWRKLDD